MRDTSIKPRSWSTSTGVFFLSHYSSASKRTTSCMLAIRGPSVSALRIETTDDDLSSRRTTK